MKTLQKLLTPVVLGMIIGMLYIIPSSLQAQTEGSFKDSRDNHIYQSVKIGNKTWMAENLKFATSSGSWLYDNDTANLASFGRLYDWTTANSSCPKGWVLPSENDWASLFTALGGKEAAGEKMQLKDSLNQKITKKVKEGGKTLSTLLGGIRHNDGTCSGIGLWGGFWSSTASSEGGKNVLFAHGEKSIGISTNDKTSGFSVRCIKK